MTHMHTKNNDERNVVRLLDEYWQQWYVCFLLLLGNQRKKSRFNQEREEKNVMFKYDIMISYVKNGNECVNLSYIIR